MDSLKIYAGPEPLKQTSLMVILEISNSPPPNFTASHTLILLTISRLSGAFCSTPYSKQNVQISPV